MHEICSTASGQVSSPSTPLRRQSSPDMPSTSMAQWDKSRTRAVDKMSEIVELGVPRKLQRRKGSIQVQKLKVGRFFPAGGTASAK